MFWKVEETVGNGCYFTHDGIYATSEAAEREAKKYPNARAVCYTSGGWGTGPQRLQKEEN